MHFSSNLQSDEDGPCTEEELKMLCTKWECRVDMTVDNFLFWGLQKLKRKTFKGNEKHFQRKWPEIVDYVGVRGLVKYHGYQEMYGDEDREFMRKQAEWRKLELRRLRYLEKLRALCANWSWSDSEDDEDEDSDDSDVESNQRNEMVVRKDNVQIARSNNRNLTVEIAEILSSNDEIQSISSVETVIERFNDNTETESMIVKTEQTEEMDVNNVANEVVVDGENVDDECIVTTQTFMPRSTSTQTDQNE